MLNVTVLDTEGLQPRPSNLTYVEFILSPYARIFYGINAQLITRPKLFYLSNPDEGPAMSSFSINSLLDLQESEYGSSSLNRARKQTFTLQKPASLCKESTDLRRSPNLITALGTENASYEGKDNTVSNSMFLASIETFFVPFTELDPETAQSQRNLFRLNGPTTG